MKISIAEYRELVGLAEPKTRKASKRKVLTAPRNRQPVNEIVLELPVPPSSNHCWVNIPGAGRVRSPKYRRWHKAAVQEAALSRGRIEGRYTVRIELGVLSHGGDVGNRSKPAVDMLAGLLTDDDSLCAKEVAEWAADTGADVAANRMRVTLRRAA